MSRSPAGRPPAPLGPAASVRAAYSRSIARLDMEQVMPAAAALAGRLGDAGVMLVIGCGHSQLLALEGFYRAGAPAWVAPLLDERVSPARGVGCTLAEREQGLGAELVSRAVTRVPARALLVVSASGRPAVPREAAETARGLGLLTLALTGGDGSNPLAALVDHVLHTGVDPADAAVRVDGVLMAPQSTVCGAVLLHALLAETEARRGRRQVLVSAHQEGGEAQNRALVALFPHLAPSP
jgi:uncharacterized phosphosugar-binding protein